MTGNKVKLKVNNSIIGVDVTTVPAGIFVSEQSLLRVAGKLGVSDEISARLKGDVRIVEREQVQLENSPFRKLVHYIIRKIFSFFDI